MALLPKALTNDSTGKYVRHSLSFVGGVLVVLGYMTVEEQAVFPDVVIAATQTPEFWGAMTTLGISIVGSIANKQK